LNPKTLWGRNRLRSYVSIDMEGLPGVSSVQHLLPGLPLYSEARDVMTRIVNLLIEEISMDGKNEVTIADSHGLMSNIKYLEVRGKATLIQGYPRPYSMMIGLDKSYDAVFFIGYHAGAGTLGGFFDHTYSSRTIYQVYVNGERASEFTLNALYAGYYGVPIALVAGDSLLEKDVRKLSPRTVFVPLKKGLARLSTSYSDLLSSTEVLRRGVREAIEKIEKGEIEPVSLPDKIELKIWLRETMYADMAQLIPGIKREGAYTLTYTASDPVDALGVIELIAWIGSGAHHLLQAMMR
jgi:D-amino peptidase